MASHCDFGVGRSDRQSDRRLRHLMGSRQMAAPAVWVSLCCRLKGRVQLLEDEAFIRSILDVGFMMAALKSNDE